METRKTAVTKLTANTYKISAQNGSGIVHKSEGRWNAKIYVRGELFRDLGSFKTRREAADTTEYTLAYEVR